MTSALVEPLAAGINGAERVVFDHSSHMAMAEEPDRYCEVLGSFLDRVDAGRRGGSAQGLFAQS
jgi:pimeloyl-ACP methyl ester carboxylesterase